MTKGKGCWQSSFAAERNTVRGCQTAGRKILGCPYLLAAELDALTFPLLLAGFSCTLAKNGWKVQISYPVLSSTRSLWIIHLFNPFIKCALVWEAPS
jgi:hypothetical protein